MQHLTVLEILQDPYETHRIFRDLFVFNEPRKSFLGDHFFPRAFSWHVRHFSW